MGGAELAESVTCMQCIRQRMPATEEMSWEGGRPRRRPPGGTDGEGSGGPGAGKEGRARPGADTALLFTTFGNHLETVKGDGAHPLGTRRVMPCPVVRPILLCISTLFWTGC